MSTSNRILADFRLNFDPDDLWSTTMEMWFDIAEGLTLAGEDVPGEWQFSFPMVDTYADVNEWCEERETLSAESVAAELNAGNVEGVLFAGKVLTKYAAVLKRAGRDY